MPPNNGNKKDVFALKMIKVTWVMMVFVSGLEVFDQGCALLSTPSH
jgi:hypothetical protein